MYDPKKTTVPGVPPPSVQTDKPAGWGTLNAAGAPALVAVGLFAWLMWGK